MQVNDEILMTQKTFRMLLQAMSRPGRIYQLANGFNLFFLVKTLLDHEVGFCVIGKEKEFLENTISEFTKCLVKDISDADFIIFSDGESKGEILKAKRGDYLYPDTGATVIYVVESLTDTGIGTTTALLKGPGIMNEIVINIRGLGNNELSYIKEVNSEFPLGIDAIFIDKTNKIMCIPRSTTVEVR